MILEDTAALKSPVSSRGFKGLSKDYAAEKIAKGELPVPNLRLKRKLMKNLKTNVSGNSITWGHIGNTKYHNKQKLKAHNHNTSKSKESTSPKRNYLPDDSNGSGIGDARSGSQFNKRIQSEIMTIIKESIDGN